MLTEKDEFIYHEMISHVPMAVHPQVEKILVIGGGDGGVVRELAKYDTAVSYTHLNSTVSIWRIKIQSLKWLCIMQNVKIWQMKLHKRHFFNYIFTLKM